MAFRILGSSPLIQTYSFSLSPLKKVGNRFLAYRKGILASKSNITSSSAFVGGGRIGVYFISNVFHGMLGAGSGSESPARSGVLEVGVEAGSVAGPVFEDDESVSGFGDVGRGLSAS